MHLLFATSWTSAKQKQNAVLQSISYHSVEHRWS
uniref:Uncharacterized protein n=1 Tax=Arundo donax TaxID=35708 RepID=A0A0A9C472_ARUDO